MQTILISKCPLDWLVKKHNRSILQHERSFGITNWIYDDSKWSTVVPDDVKID